MDRYYIGLRDDGAWEVFRATKAQATPELTGYHQIAGPFDTKAEAEEAATY